MALPIFLVKFMHIITLLSPIMLGGAYPIAYRSDWEKS
jgi:hypothetical protein